MIPRSMLSGSRATVAAGRRLLAGTALLLCAAGCTPPTHGQDGAPLRIEPAEVPADLGARAMRRVEEIVAMGPRHPGSPGWRRQLDYIEEHLTGLGLTVHRDVWTDPDEGITFTNVLARIPGSRPDRVMLACHHDTKVTHGHDDPAHNFEFVGANDGASGVALLLTLAEELVARGGDDPRPTYELAFFDGEESLDFHWNTERALFGSRRYMVRERLAQARGTATGELRAMILLDLVGAADLQIDDDTNSDPRLKRIFRAAAAACGHGALFFRHSLAVSDDHLPFVRAGIPAIVLIDLHDNPQWHTADDTLDHLSARSLQIVGEVTLTALPEVVATFVPGATRDR